MGSHSTRKEERRARKELKRTLRRERKERKRTLRREHKERKRAEKAARKEARRLRREARHTRDAANPAELDELRRLRYLRATGAPTPVELYEARAWRDGAQAYRPPAHYAPPTQAELDELRRLRYLRAGEATEVEVAQARDFFARASDPRDWRDQALPPRQTAPRPSTKKSLNWGASVYSPHQTARTPPTTAVIKGDIQAHLAARKKSEKREREKRGTPINPPELVFDRDGKTIHAEIVRGRTNGGKFQFELRPFEGKGESFWVNADLLQNFARDTSLRSWCADPVAQNCAASSYPAK